MNQVSITVDADRRLHITAERASKHEEVHWAGPLSSASSTQMPTRPNLLKYPHPTTLVHSNTQPT